MNKPPPLLVYRLIYGFNGIFLWFSAQACNLHPECVRPRRTKKRNKQLAAWWGGAVRGKLIMWYRKPETKPKNLYEWRILAGKMIKLYQTKCWTFQLVMFDCKKVYVKLTHLGNMIDWGSLKFLRCTLQECVNPPLVHQTGWIQETRGPIYPCGTPHFTSAKHI